MEEARDKRPEYMARIKAFGDAVMNQERQPKAFVMAIFWNDGTMSTVERVDRGAPILSMAGFFHGLAGKLAFKAGVLEDGEPVVDTPEPAPTDPT